jgi:phenylpropionate dioxygenase-like ring-hydroxylating dioxygenase large terminal subunit
MGELFRQYWLPAMLAEELPDDDWRPVRAKLLSERMIAFRDSQGRYGLMDEFCAHRGLKEADADEFHVGHTGLRGRD